MINWRRLIPILVIFVIFSPSVSALSDAQKQVFDEGIYYFNTEDGNCQVDVSVDLSGNDNAEKAFNYYLGKGLSPVQAAAILGNFRRESGVDPKKVQGGTESDQPIAGKGYGLAQWTDSGRQKALSDFAISHSQPVSDLGLQLDFSIKEASDKSVLDNLKQIKALDVATKYWMDSYEAPAASTARLDLRIQYAQAYLAQFGGSAGGTDVSTSTDFSSCDSVVGSGVNTKYYDGFTVYSQYDPSWANKSYGTSTIAASGCGPSAMAMIITALSGAPVTPDVTASYAGSKGLYLAGQGSSWSIAPVLAEHWGLKSKLIGASIQKISATLQAGGLVIASGQGPLPFTSGGHYIVIRAVTAEGKWKVGDSGHNDTSDKTWDPETLINSMNDGSVYAISK